MMINIDIVLAGGNTYRSVGVLVPASGSSMLLPRHPIPLYDFCRLSKTFSLEMTESGLRN
jgi:hypothetical protein